MPARRLSEIVVLPTPPFGVKTAMTVIRVASLQHPFAHGRDDNLGDDHDPEDGQKDHSDAVPLEKIERGIEGHADATGAHEAEHGRLADVDIPAEESNRPEGRLHLRPVAEGETRQWGRPGSIECL